jgi:hypothetical protein
LSSRLDPDRPVLRLAFFALLAFAAGPPAGAQSLQQTDGNLQLGLSALPGLGAQVGYLDVAGLFTREGTLYIDGRPALFGGEENVEVWLAGGASVRTLGVARLFTDADFGGYDFDVGFRAGPSLTFISGATEAEKNQQFSFVFEPFLRVVTQLRPGLTVYGEAGPQPSLLRGGLWLTL